MTLSTKCCYVCKKPVSENPKDYGTNYINPSYFHYDCLDKTDELDGVYLLID